MADDKKNEQERENVGTLGQVDYIYVSNVQMFSNNWDLRLAFGDRRPDNTDVPKVGLVMSHQHAKAMSLVLAKQIEKLEETFGPIEYGAKSLDDSESAES